MRENVITPSRRTMRHPSRFTNHVLRFTFHDHVSRITFHVVMHVNSESFIQDSTVAVQNKTLQTRLRVLTGFTVKRNLLFAELPDGEALRDRAREIKEETIANLEENVVSLGGTVHWARTGNEARTIVLELARKNNVKRVVKVKSMVTEEI